MNNYLDIIIFAVIAVVLLLRLRSVLGTRSEDEPKGMGLPMAAPRTETVAGTHQFVDAPGETDFDRWAQSPPNFVLVDTATVHNHLMQFLAVEPGFRPHDFLDKAKKAFDIIVSAFAQGNKNTLQLLLSQSLYAAFAKQIDARETGRETYFTTVHGIKKALITGAELNGTQARVTVDITAEQSITHKDDEGRIVNEQDGSRRTTHDRWVFAKDLKDNDPVWKLDNTVAIDD